MDGYRRWSWRILLSAICCHLVCCTFEHFVVKPSCPLRGAPPSRRAVGASSVRWTLSASLSLDTNTLIFLYLVDKFNTPSIDIESKNPRISMWFRVSGFQMFRTNAMGFLSSLHVVERLMWCPSIGGRLSTFEGWCDENRGAYSYP